MAEPETIEDIARDQIRGVQRVLESTRARIAALDASIPKLADQLHQARAERRQLAEDQIPALERRIDSAARLGISIECQESPGAPPEDAPEGESHD